MKDKIYPEQSPDVKGKIWLNLTEDRTLMVSPQARNTLKFYHIDEEKFITKLKELFLECFSDVKGEGFRPDHEYNFEKCAVSKATFDYEREDDGSEEPHFKIEIWNCCGRKKTESCSK